MSSINSAKEDFYDVYLGFWINWSHGRVRGATITLSRNNGSLLIAFLALFVAASGKSFWRLLCFALHQATSAPATPQDGFYHQRQAILRNSETAMQGGWEIFNSMIAWKRSNAAKRLLRRCIPMVATAVVLSCGFTLASIFSSRVSSGDPSEVLLSGHKCGKADTAIDYLAYEHEYSPWRSHRSQEFLFYARSCYHNISNTQSCNLYVKPRLRLQADRNASCPFAPEICLASSGNLRLDSGFVNTHYDLGINAVAKNRLEFRHVYHCAPIKTKGYSEIVRGVPDARNRTTTSLFRLFYGAFAGYSKYRPNYKNYTYQVPINVSYVNSDSSSSEINTPVPDYRIGSVTSYGNIGDSFLDLAYKPIPELQVDNADVIILFLSAHDINFQTQVDDPWFSAHTKGKRMTGSDHGQDRGWTYRQDEPATALACTRQVQFCKATQEPDDRRCEPLRGARGQDYIPVDLGDEHANDLVQTVNELVIINLSPLEYLTDMIGTSILVAKSGLVGSTQGELPSNQWQIEMENLISTNLAAFQGSSVDSVSGPPTRGIERVWSPPNSTMTRKFCKSQKILSSRYSSFNVLGLSLILAIGALIILLHFLLEPTGRRICGYRTRKAGRKQTSEDEETATSPRSHSGGSGKEPLDELRTADTNITAVEQPVDAKILKYSEWNVNSTLQLQRLAHEAVGAGTWHRTTLDVPVTSPDQVLGTLTFMRPPREHPYLVGPVVRRESDGEEKPSPEAAERRVVTETEDVEEIEISGDGGADEDIGSQSRSLNT